MYYVFIIFKQDSFMPIGKFFLRFICNFVYKFVLSLHLCNFFSSVGCIVPETDYSYFLCRIFM